MFQLNVYTSWFKNDYIISKIDINPTNDKMWLYEIDGIVMNTKCPECVKENLTSIIQLSNGIVLLKGEKDQYYDEKGTLHLHNSCVKVGPWECSNNHHGTFRKYWFCIHCKE